MPPSVLLFHNRLSLSRVSLIQSLFNKLFKLITSLNMSLSAKQSSDLEPDGTDQLLPCQ